MDLKSTFPLKSAVICVVIIGVAVGLYVAFFRTRKSLNLEVSGSSSALDGFHPNHLSFSGDNEPTTDPLEIKTNTNTSQSPTCNQAWQNPTAASREEILSYTPTSFAVQHLNVASKTCRFVADPVDAHWQISYTPALSSTALGYDPIITERMHVEVLGMSLMKDCTPVTEANLEQTHADCVRAVFAPGRVFVYSGTGTLVSYDSNHKCISCLQVEQSDIGRQDTQI
jgi:hypothetical protein